MLVRIGNEEPAQELVEHLVLAKSIPDEFRSRPQFAYDVHGDAERLGRVERLDELECWPQTLPGGFAEQIDQESAVEVNHRFTARAVTGRRAWTCLCMAPSVSSPIRRDRTRARHRAAVGCCPKCYLITCENDCRSFL